MPVTRALAASVPSQQAYRPVTVAVRACTKMSPAMTSQSALRVRKVTFPIQRGIRNAIRALQELLPTKMAPKYAQNVRKGRSARSRAQTPRTRASCAPGASTMRTGESPAKQMAAHPARRENGRTESAKAAARRAEHVHRVGSEEELRRPPSTIARIARPDDSTPLWRKQTPARARPVRKVST